MAIHEKDPIAEVAASMVRLLDSPSESHPAGAILVAIEYAERCHYVLGTRPMASRTRERLQVTLAAVLESLQAIGTALENTPPSRTD